MSGMGSTAQNWRFELGGWGKLGNGFRVPNKFETAQPAVLQEHDQLAEPVLVNRQPAGRIKDRRTEPCGGGRSGSVDDEVDRRATACALPVDASGIRLPSERLDARIVNGEHEAQCRGLLLR